MPIFYKGEERVMFAHIPKTAGISIYVWFCDNGWFISNLKLQKTGAGEIFRSRYGISQCQIEGHQEIGTNPQHAEATIYIKWKKFTSEFCLIRNPLDRFLSELRYYFDYICKKNNIKSYSKFDIQQFIESYTKMVFSEYQSNKRVRDNHIRPQCDFITENTKILRYEDNWEEFLAEQYNLKGFPLKLNTSCKKYDFYSLLTPSLKKIITDFYKQDYDTFGYRNG